MFTRTLTYLWELATVGERKFEPDASSITVLWKWLLACDEDDIDWMQLSVGRINRAMLDATRSVAATDGTLLPGLFELWSVVDTDSLIAEGDSWSVLCWQLLAEALGRDDELIRWYERSQTSYGFEQMLGMSSTYLQQLLYSDDHWRMLGLTYANPVMSANLMYQEAKKFLSTHPQYGDCCGNGSLVEGARKMACTMYAACIAAEREDDAHQLKDVILKHDHTADAYLALLGELLDSHQLTREHLEWVERASDLDPEHPELDRVRENVNRYLGM